VTVRSQTFAVSENAARARTVPRLALTKVEAAESLGMSVDSFERYVMPDVRVVRQGRLVLVSTRELEAWLDRSGARTLGVGA
jgi:hypothetical protein